jgi:RNA 3'-terminal phosphate cyclase
VEDCVLCAKKANERFVQEPTLWNAVMTADAYLVEALCRGTLGNEGKTFEQVGKRYAEALTNIQFAPKDLDSVTQQLCLLALLFEAKGEIRTPKSRAKADAAVAARLRQLAERIQPGSSMVSEKPERKEIEQKVAPAQSVPRRRTRRRRR